MARKKYKIQSVGKIGKQLNDRLKVAKALNADLEKGAKAIPPLPMKFEGTALMQSRALVKNLEAAIDAVADVCGDNTLSAGYTVESGGGNG